MNRVQRRQMKKRLKGKNIVLDKGAEKVAASDPKKEVYCRYHPLKLDDIDHPTERDKRLIETVRLQTKKTVMPDGRTRVYKICPRCNRCIDLDIIDVKLIL